MRNHLVTEKLPANAAGRGNSVAGTREVKDQLLWHRGQRGDNWVQALCTEYWQFNYLVIAESPLILSTSSPALIGYSGAYPNTHKEEAGKTLWQGTNTHSSLSLS